MPEITQGNIPRYGAGKTLITACDVIKTTQNNHPSHVGWDTRPQDCDTRPVDLEKTCWNYMEAIGPETVGFTLLRPVDELHVAPRGHVARVGTTWRPVMCVDCLVDELSTPHELKSLELSWRLSLLLLLLSYACSILTQDIFIPHPYTVITLLSFLHCFSQPFQYLSVPNRAHTCLLNKSKVKQRLSPQYAAANREPGFLAQALVHANLE